MQSLGLQASSKSSCASKQNALAFSASPRLVSSVTMRQKRSATVQCQALAKTLTGCRLAGVGSCLPTKILHNKDMEALVNTTDDWISSRTGIRQRHIIGKDENLAKLATVACKQALEMAGVSEKDVDMIIFASSTPDDSFGNACQVQAGLGASRAVAFDLTAACSGFVVAMNTGAQFIRTGAARQVLVVGADAMSRIIDWRDRATCVLFGDGCGALLLSAKEPGSGADCSLLGMCMASDGHGQKSLNAVFAGEHEKPLLPAAAASGMASYRNVSMAGQEVYKFAVRTVPAAIDAALERAGLQKSDVDWLVMHQANQRIMDAAAHRLGLPAERVISNLARYGNTSAASIPIALDEAVRGGQIKKGDKIAMVGFGAGLTWASAIVRWG